MALDIFPVFLFSNLGYDAEIEHKAPGTLCEICDVSGDLPSYYLQLNRIRQIEMDVKAWSVFKCVRSPCLICGAGKNCSGYQKARSDPLFARFLEERKERKVLANSIRGTDI